MADEEAPGRLEPGAFVGGRYKIDRLIGRGGMGEVYSAHHVTTGKEVALKMIRPSVDAPPDLAHRFMREARTATAIQHPNVIEVFDVFIDTDGTPVMVMELLKGESFFDYRLRRGALHLHEVSTILVPALEALRAAHEKGIVHRDLKPDNIFLAETPGGVVTKVLDFGIAKVLDPGKLGSDTEGPRTQTNMMLGTPYYMSLEQAMSDRSIDQRADIWSMGVIIFEALTGRRPIEFDTLGQMYTALLRGTIPSIGAVLGALPPDVLNIIDRCLRKERDGRLEDVGPLIDVLRRYGDAKTAGAMVGGTVIGELPDPVVSGATNEPLSSSIGGSRTRGVGRKLLLGGAALVLVGGVLVVGMTMRGRARPPLTPPVTAASPPNLSNAVAGLPSEPIAAAREAPIGSAPAIGGPSASSSAASPANASSPDAGRTRPHRPANAGAPSAHGIAPDLPY